MKGLFLIIYAAITTLLISSCEKEPEPTPSTESVVRTKPETQPDVLPDKAPVASTQKIPAIQPQEKLKAILAAQPDKVKARYTARHPQATLEFFGIKPGMTVVEILPGGGWYTKILLPYLGTGGWVIGADYAADMYPKFGIFSEEMLESKKTWIDSWTSEAQGWRNKDGAAINAFQLGVVPLNRRKN